MAKQVDAAFTALGWEEKQFQTSIKIDELEFESPTHKVDCFKGRVALELEWNNKDPFYDRDLNNFRLLFDLRAIDVGVVLARDTRLNPIFKELGKYKSYGASTTHSDKLWPRLDGGGGGMPRFGVRNYTGAIHRRRTADAGADSGSSVGAGRGLIQVGHALSVFVSLFPILIYVFQVLLELVEVPLQL